MGTYTTTKQQPPTANPPIGQLWLYPDTNGNWRKRDENGNDYCISPLTNQSTAAQVLAAATLTYIAGTNISIPPTKLQKGTRLKWKLAITKTAAGTASSTYSVLLGTHGDVTDAAILVFTKPAGTAAADEGVITIEATVQSIGVTGVIIGEFTLIHNLTATGHATIPCVCVNVVSAATDLTVANMIIGVAAATGAADAITVSMASVEGLNI